MAANRNHSLQSALDHLRANRFDRAADLCRSLLGADQNDVDARFLLAVAMDAGGQTAQAAEHLVKVIQARPDHLDAHRELIAMMRALGRRAEAEAAFRALLTRTPRDAATRSRFGQFLMEEGRANEAAAEADAALALQPNFPAAHNLLGASLVERGRMEEAIAAFRRAIAADPAHVWAYSNLATALATEGRFAESHEAARKALDIAPNDVTVRLNNAMVLLKSGQLSDGWGEHEWRHQKPGRRKLPAALMLPPLARIGSLKDRTVFVYHEEGFGDSLQFLRYVPLLARAGARVILWMPEPLVRLSRDLPGVDAVLTGTLDLPKFDFHCPIISLPYVFDTKPETIPAAPYIRADPILAQTWRERLPAKTCVRVGLAWSGEPRPYDLTAMAIDRRRSLPLASLAPLLAVGGVSFVSLQTGAPARELGPVLAQTRIDDPMGAVTDFADTAAIIANLDLVISVDTAVAHLAGAMGAPVFLLDRYDNCWRWLSGRSDSPWYPAMTIFRQPRMGEWAPAIAAAAAALASFAAPPDAS